MDSGLMSDREVGDDHAKVRKEGGKEGGHP